MANRIFTNQEETSKNSIEIILKPDQIANLKLFQKTQALKGHDVTIPELVSKSVDHFVVSVVSTGIDELLEYIENFRGK